MSPLLGLAKLVLGPLLLWQGRRVRASALRLPEAPGARAGRCGGTPGSLAGVHLTFVGDSSCAGVGLPSQEVALPHLAAQAVAHGLSQTVTWVSVARSGVCSVEALRLWQDHQGSASPSDRSDALVVVLGVNDVTAQRSPQAFARSVRALVEAVQRDVYAPRVVCCAVPPMDQFPALPQPLRWYLGRCSRQLDEALQGLCRSQPGWHYCGLGWSQPGDPMASDGYHPGPEQVRRWAAAVATGILQACTPSNRL